MNSVMYRDIKPDNIGFDVRGAIKLFDFGLAREYDPSKRLNDGTFANTTGDTGSPRYMDPDVALSNPYNELCDVYSFCVLLWEMLELVTPFLGYDMRMFTKKVVQGGTRPKINTGWSKAIQDILGNGFMMEDEVSDDDANEDPLRLSVVSVLNLLSVA
jgi:serine/threonine protein kinase